MRQTDLQRAAAEARMGAGGAGVRTLAGQAFSY